MFFKTIDFSKYSSIKIGQVEEVLVLENADEIPTDRYLIGGANNLLLSPNPPALMVLGKDFSTINLQRDILTIGASMPTGRIVSYARKHNLSGFEFLAKLPGMLGGILAMNAGVKSHEIFNILHSIKIEGKWIPKEEIDFGYRFAKLPGVATAAQFHTQEGFDQKLLDELVALRNNQPKDPSAGSAFKNPEGDHAGRLIEAVGLKGKREGDMAWSGVHANFLVNLGDGNFEDAHYLITLAQEKIFQKFGIELQTEIKIL